MKTIKQLMEQHAGKWPADPRSPTQRGPQWQGRPFPFPVDKFGHRS
jgi:hypothetical protein